MSNLFLDIETRSGADLKKTGVYRYAEDPEFEILMCAWSNGGPTRVAVGQDAIRQIPGLRDPAVTKIAHNAQFERVCFSRFLGLEVGQYLDPDEWDDTMVLAAEAGHPTGLADLALALGAEAKDTAGTRLINLFSKPNRTGGWNRPADYPEQWDEFVEYCRQDVDTMIDVYHRLPGWPTPDEAAVWRMDQRINDRGMLADLPLARLAIAADAENQSAMSQRLRDLLGIENPGSVIQVATALADTGLELENLRADTVREALLREDLSEVQREALQLRVELALVAAKKYQAILNRASADSRVRGQFRFFGAHTGRWSGSGVQLQNLPRHQLKHPEAAILDLRLGLGAGPQDLKALVRPTFLGPLAVVDYSAIEARVLAWLAGEQWAIDAFAAGRDIYTETANRMGGMTRQEGKVATLALGYQGGVNSLSHMGAKGTHEELDWIKVRWRKANQRIVRYWARLEEMFAEGGREGPIQIRASDRDRFVYLPSGRWLTYHQVKFDRWRDTAEERTKQGWRYSGLRGRVDMYGGRLAENIVQAVSRDLLAHAMAEMERRGLRVVGHVHDEVLIEGGQAELDLAVELIRTNPSWAEGLPLDAEGFLTRRYRKG